jgi:hypothetical protein
MRKTPEGFGEAEPPRLSSSIRIAVVFQTVNSDLADE